MDQKKSMIWMGSSKKDFMNFPNCVKYKIGHALYMAQRGDKPKDSKFLKGFNGGSVLEIVENNGQGSYRTIYTVQVEKAVVVLHAFQKKSKSGIKTPKQDMNLIKQRLKNTSTIQEWNLYEENT